MTGTRIDDPFRATQFAAVHAAYSHAFGARPDAFESGELTILPRLDAAPFPYIAVAFAGARGSVLSVSPDLLDVATTRRPPQHHEIVRPQFLTRFQRQDPPVEFHGPEILWALGSAPLPPALPARLRIEERDASWLNAEQASLRFPNGVGRPGVNARAERNRYAVAIVDATGEPMAVAGVFDSFGLLEIGVDVLPERQGAGLGIAVVAAAVRSILERSQTPLYGCAADNIRSQRTALSVGFLPILTEAGVS